MRGDNVVTLVRAESLLPPVRIGNGTTGVREELDPEILLNFMMPWLVSEASEELLIEVGRELKNSSINQG